MKERYLICVDCPQYLEPADRCSVCGCYVNLKVRFEASHCPKGKW